MLSNDQKLEMYEGMLRIRSFEERVVDLFAAGQILTSRRLVCLLVRQPPMNNNEQQNPNTSK